MIGAGQRIQKELKTIRIAQFRILYTTLYLCGLRLNKVSQLTKKDLFLAIQTAKIPIFHTKTHRCQIHILPKSGKK